MDFNEPFAKEETRIMGFVVSHTAGLWLWNEQHLVSGQRLQPPVLILLMLPTFSSSSILRCGALQTHKHRKTCITVLLHLQT
jgi:hypothetical protein